MVGDEHLSNENREGEKEGRKDSGRAADFLSFIIMTIACIFLSGKFCIS